MINIAIDGPAGAGKSTVAKCIAKTLGILYLDTGAMYRAFALYFIRIGIAMDDAAEITARMAQVNIEVKYEDGQQHIYLNGADVSEDIRQHEVSKCASEISKIKEVRLMLVQLQREIAQKNDVIMDGRDIGSYVLPHANYKFFLTASPEVRARRRLDELTAKGQSAEYNTILSDITERDKNDSTRAFAPLICAEDAVLIDSTMLSEQQVCEKITGYIKKK